MISSAESDNDVEKLKKLGADTVVSPTKLTAQRIGVMAARPDMENLLEEFLYRSDTPLDMEEVFVPKSSWLVLKKLVITSYSIHYTKLYDQLLLGTKTSSISRGVPLA